jgi:hypothetical protein
VILYDYQCDAGHMFEHLAELADFDKAVPCIVANCRRPAARVIVHAPGMNFGAGERRVYHQHNITAPGRSADGTVVSLPNSVADQCQCGDCASHRRRASVTDVAEPGKARYI